MLVKVLLLYCSHTVAVVGVANSLYLITLDELDVHTLK